jgi:O-antigen/teichoic acid export membrane protein
MFKYRLQSDFAKNIITLVTGTSIAQAIAFIAAPIISRYYSPEDFAQFALFVSTAAIASVVATARYELAIPLPKIEKDAKNILALSLIICTILSIIVLSGIALYDCLTGTGKSKLFSNWFYLIPISVLASGFFNAFNYWSTRVGTFRMNSAGRIVLAIVTSLISIILGFFAFGAKGLIIGLVTGQIVSMVILANPIFRKFKLFFEGVSYKNLKLQANTYKSFFKINSPHALLDAIQDNGVVYLLSFYFVDAVTGWYSFAFRILKAPVGLIGSALYQVFYQRLSQTKNEAGDLRPLVRKMYMRMFLIGFPGFLILFLFAPQIFEFVFGPKWHSAGIIARVLTPWLFFNFIISPVSCITLVCNKQKQAFLFTIADSTIRFTALVIGGIKNDYMLSFYIISAFSSFIMIIALWWYYYLAKKNSIVPDAL